MKKYLNTENLTIGKEPQGKQREQEGEACKKLQADPTRLAKLQSSEIEKSIRYTKQRYDALGKKGKKSCSTQRQRQRLKEVNMHPHFFIRSRLRQIHTDHSKTHNQTVVVSAWLSINSWLHISIPEMKVFHAAIECLHSQIHKNTSWTLYLQRRW